MKCLKNMINLTNIKKKIIEEENEWKETDF